MSTQETLYKRISNNILNMWKTDKKRQIVIHDHIKAGMVPPHVEARNDVNKFQQQWIWKESLNCGGFVVEIDNRDFYVRYDSHGNIERLTPYENL